MGNIKYFGFWKKESLIYYKLVSLSNTGVHIIWFNKWKLIYSWSTSMELISLSMIAYL